MTDITFGPGREPLIRDGHQERFWALFSAEAAAMDALRQAEETGGDVVRASAIRERALEQLERFVQEHPDREFAVFRPKLVDAAFVEGVPSMRFEDDLPADGPTG
jgi:hypothetical protein